MGALSECRANRDARSAPIQPRLSSCLGGLHSNGWRGRTWREHDARRPYHPTRPLVRGPPNGFAVLGLRDRGRSSSPPYSSRPRPSESLILARVYDWPQGIPSWCSRATKNSGVTERVLPSRAHSLSSRPSGRCPSSAPAVSYPSALSASTGCTARARRVGTTAASRHTNNIAAAYPPTDAPSTAPRLPA